MNIIRHDGRPGWDMLDDLFPMASRWFGDDANFGYVRYPAVNVWHSDEEIVVDAELPGVDPQKVDVSLSDTELTISGERPTERVEAEAVYHRRERPYGKFARSITLPYRGEAGKVTATYKNGILRVVVPRAEADKPRRIMIEAA